MLKATHQTSISINIMHLGRNGQYDFGIRYEPVISDEEYKKFDKENFEAIFERLDKESTWRRCSRDYRINFYGKDFAKFAKKPKRKLQKHPFSHITKRKP